MKVLSLFDGMACGMLAMLKQGVEVERYVAYEIDKYAIQTSSHNFPMIEHRGDVFKADFAEFEGFDCLIGGSPCTHWSIAQKNNRETEANGMGWELFSQYVRALREAKPKYFIYENNKSMSKAIRESIDNAFGFEAVFINSALVSAQNRQRLYWVGKRNEDGTYLRANVEQPEDRGIVLRDILESSVVDRVYSCDGKSVTLSANGGGQGGKTGLYATPIDELEECAVFNNPHGWNNGFMSYGKFPTLATGSCSRQWNTIIQDVESATEIIKNEKPLRFINKVYEVKNGLITIKDKPYPIKLKDGHYIIRKLTVRECMRLQTVPEWYEFPISSSQAYKMLGNGWTVDVIVHILKGVIKNENRNT